jgi:hypothetical protein
MPAGECHSDFAVNYPGPLPASIKAGLRNQIGLYFYSVAGAPPLPRSLPQGGDFIASPRCSDYGISTLEMMSE